ncbi:hypothetical protein D3C77_106590 [compost metagenome]
MNVNKRLVHLPRGFHQDRVSDLLVVFMANIEEALLDSGATPSVDYNRQDLLQAATPFVLSIFDDRTRHSPLELVTEFPENGQRTSNNGRPDGPGGDQRE